MRILVAWVMLCVSGCAPTGVILRGDYGYGAQYAIAKSVNEISEGVKEDGEPRLGLPLDGHFAYLGIGLRWETCGLDPSILLGPSIFIPTRGPKNDLVGLELRVRLAYSDLPVRPFIEGFFGYGYTRRRWWGEGTHHLFSVGGTIGVSIPIESWSLDLGYRYHHISNGAVVFGAKSPNAGYNTDMLIFGIEKRF